MQMPVKPKNKKAAAREGMCGQCRQLRRVKVYPQHANQQLCRHCAKGLEKGLERPIP